ncbi:MAG: response regulator [Tepidisphaeraceae bacterium]
MNCESSKTRPCILVVDDEPALVELVGDIVGNSMDCRVISAGNLREAAEMLKSESIELLVTDVGLPDGDGLSLLPELRSKQPQAGALVITGKPSLTGAIAAMRAGVMDFLPKPFSADCLMDRVRRALDRQAITVRNEKRMQRLRRAVRKLGASRRTISRKVDLLCNDLVSAYGELSKQVDDLRTQESFRKLVDGAKDLEQLLCHGMDWILRHAGYANVAVWLAADDHEFELGAYMKYTVPGERELIDAMKNGLLPLVQREGVVHLHPDEIVHRLTPAETEYLAGNTVLAANCTYLGESLASFVMFRDSRSPFSEADEQMLRSICPIFATALASIVKKSNKYELDDQSPFYSPDEDTMTRDEEERRRRRDSDKADWWKRGEPPPF